MRRQLFTLALMLMAIGATAQENELSLDAQLRTRGEYNNGAGTPRGEGQLPKDFINERARLSLDYQRDNLEMKASVQHTGLWGQDGMNTANGRVTMNEAWAKMKFGNGYFVQIGRQQLAYDDDRILGTLDWNVNGNWHDALKMGYERNGHKVHFILGYNQAAANPGDFYSGPMGYRDLSAVWYHYQSQKAPFAISFLGLNLGRKDAENGDGKKNYMQTLGTDITYKPSDFNIHGAFYYQTGKDATGTKHSAWMASAKVGYTIDPVWGVNVGYDYLSGNDGEGDKVKAFDALYGTHHKFYGFMDFFPGKLSQGLQDIQAGVTAKASPKVSALLNYHYFLTAEKVGDLDKGLGHEVDLQLTVTPMKNVTLMAGYSFMLGTETMDVVKGGNHNSWQDWAWVQLNINPRIFFTKW
ncbi:MAG: alginate export family protein [Prevotella sp.]|nr:alginate export family protein [Prevotella sp.]